MPKRCLDLLLLLASLTGVLAFQYIFASQTYFLADDFLFFRLAIDNGVGFHILGEALFQHYSPGRVVVDFSLTSLAPVNFEVALAIELAMLAGVLLAIRALLTELFGSSRWNLVLIVMFGTSLSLVTALEWWSQAIFTLPSLLSTSLTLLFALKYARTRKWIFLALAFVAYCIGILFFEKVLLTPFYLALILVLFKSRSLRPRAILNVLWKERWTWLLLGLASAAHLINYRLHNFAGDPIPVTLEQLDHFIRVTWLRAFSPMLIGRVIPVDPSVADEWMVVLAQVIILSTVAYSLYRKHSAWRAWLFWASVFLLNTLLVGLTRVGQFGIQAGYDIRYLPELTFLFVLSLGFAFYPHDLINKSHLHVVDRSTQEISERQLSRTKFRRCLTWGLASLAIAFYAVSDFRGAEQIQARNLSPPNRSYIANVRESLTWLEKTGRPMVLLDGLVPETIIPSWLPAYNRVLPVLSLIDDRVRLGGTSKDSISVGLDGRFYRAVFSKKTGGKTTSLKRGDLTTNPPDRTQSSGDYLCIKDQPIPIELIFHANIANQSPLYLLVKTQPLPENSDPLGLLVDRGGGPALDRTIDLRGRNQSVVELGSTKITAVQIIVPAHTSLCVSRIEIGKMNIASKPLH